MTDAEILIGASLVGRVTPHTADALSACIRLFDLGHLTICPPGDRYKLSERGREVVREMVR